MCRGEANQTLDPVCVLPPMHAPYMYVAAFLPVARAPVLLMATENEYGNALALMERWRM